MHTYIKRITLSYKRILYIKVALTNYLTNSLSIFIGKTLVVSDLVEARVRQKGRASLYDWIVYKRGSKARERKREKG